MVDSSYLFCLANKEAQRGYAPGLKVGNVGIGNTVSLRCCSMRVKVLRALSALLELAA